jgi:hypothetical protein
MVVKTVGDTVEEAVVAPAAMVAATLGASARGADGSAPGTRGKMVAMLRAELIRAQHYLQQQEAGDPAPAPDLRLEVFGRVLERELPLLVTAHYCPDGYREPSIALRTRRLFDISVLNDRLPAGTILNRD